MDEKRFDLVVQALAEGASRRRVLRGLIGGLVGGAALGGAHHTSADESEPESLDQSTETTAPPAATTPPPVETTSPPPVGGQSEEVATTLPPTTEAPPEPEVTTTAAPTQEILTESSADANTANQTPSSCPDDWTLCETLCCEPGWRCCGVYCIPDFGEEGRCCGDAECPTCQICSLDGWCIEICKELEKVCCIDDEANTFTCGDCCRDDPECFDFVDCEFCSSIEQQCCYNEKHHTVSCAHCCDDLDCQHEYGPCHTCYGGYCLSCFDQTDGHAPVCISECVSAAPAAGGEIGPICLQCCYDEQCGPCGRCNEGWCERECENCCYDSYCAHECCYHEDCPSCEFCFNGYCESDCSSDQVCCDNGYEPYCGDPSDGCCGGPGQWCDIHITSEAGERLSGSCCYGLVCCYDEHSHDGRCAECCDDGNCQSGWQCCDGVCHKDCCKDKDCVEGVCTDDGYCVQCRSDYHCPHGYHCCEQGYCIPNENCCDDSDCGDCETCGVDWYCLPTGVGLYGACNPMEVFFGSEEDSPQLNCCHGLVCCETRHDGLLCLECCGDYDCAYGCSCNDGHCSCPCGSDSDCPKGTCCCKNGACSADCCAKPGHPHKPHTPPKGGGVETIDTLPSTGSGSSQSRTGWIGAAALGAAAAYLAGKKLTESEAPSEMPEE